MDEKMRDKYLRIFSVACLLTLSGCGVKDVSEANTDGVKISVSIKHHQENDYPEPVSQQLEVSISLNEDDKYLNTNSNNQLTLTIGETTYDLNNIAYKHRDTLFGYVHYEVNLSDRDFEEVGANIVFNTSERLSLDFKIPKILSIETNLQPNYSPDNDNLVIDWHNQITPSETLIRLSQNSATYESPACSKYTFESTQEIYTHRIDAGTICKLDDLGGVLHFTSTPVNFDYINDGFKAVNITHQQFYQEKYVTN